MERWVLLQESTVLFLKLALHSYFNDTVVSGLLAKMNDKKWRKQKNDRVHKPLLFSLKQKLQQECYLITNQEIQHNKNL
jgi:hypothetical protein